MEEVHILSSEEEDQLHRSTKKHKQILDVLSPEKSLVKETQLGGGTQTTNNGEGPRRGEAFPTTIGLSMARKIISYKDVCLGVNGNPSPDDAKYAVYESECEDDDISDGKWPLGGSVGGDPLCPVVNLSPVEKKQIRILWKQAVIIKLLGRKSFSVGRLIFFPYDDDLRRVVVWVRIPGLPVEYYDRSILRRIGNVIGKTVKIDGNSLMGSTGPLRELFSIRAKFARLCVEVDLRKVMISRFILNGKVFLVEYEGLHQVCFSCGRYGHRKDACPLNDKGAAVDQGDGVPPPNQQPVRQEGEKPGDENFGPWMLVQKGGRRRQQPTEGKERISRDPKEVNQQGNLGKDSGSHFSILNDNMENRIFHDGDLVHNQHNINGEIGSQNIVDDVAGDNVFEDQGGNHYNNDEVPTNQERDLVRKKGFKIRKRQRRIISPDKGKITDQFNDKSGPSHVEKETPSKCAKLPTHTPKPIGVSSQSRISFKGVRDTARRFGNYSCPLTKTT
ncbi:Zinc finger, CCHC-type [Sesbania bispinosa]|nr:Zinc finger, CCHC-type [Sesbania bispinosa]